MVQPNKVFTGFKVLDVASFIAGPAAATIRSDFGGAAYATPPYPVAQTNYGWQLNNRNKRSIALTRKSEQAKEMFWRLVKWADVLATNFPPKLKADLGLTYKVMSAVNSGLIYADISGSGSNGPEADKPGFDITAYWAGSLRKAPALVPLHRSNIQRMSRGEANLNVRRVLHGQSNERYWCSERHQETRGASSAEWRLLSGH